MKQIVQLTSLLLIAAMLSACSSIPRYTVTLTSAVDSASKEYATMYKAGLIPPEVAANAARVHGEYQRLAGVAEQALIAYKLSEDPAQYRQAFEAVRQAGLAFVNMLLPYIVKEKGDTMVKQINNASKLK